MLPAAALRLASPALRALASGALLQARHASWAAASR